MSLVIDSLTKFYGQQQVLKNISLKVDKGEIVGFLGPNGAGKSTTMKIITGFVKPNSGNVFVDDISIIQNTLEAQKHIGYLPEHNPLYLEMYVKEYLLFVAHTYKLGKEASKRVDEMIEKTGLRPEFKKKLGQLSKGYRQRVGLAQAMIHNPQVLILDEPTTGLDPNQLVEIRNLIKEVGKDKTVILSTHIMQEVKAICDRYVIINDGKIVTDTKKYLVDEDSKKYVTIVEFASKIDVKLLKQMLSVTKCELMQHNRFIIESSTDIRQSLFNIAVNINNPIQTLYLNQEDVEDVFRKMTKKLEN